MQQDNQPTSVIVYHSRGEQALDNYLWDHGGDTLVGGCLLVAFVLVCTVFYGIFSDRNRLFRGRR